MSVKDLLSRPLTTLSQWCKSHEEFIAVRVTRLVGVGFIAASFIFLLKSLGIL